MKLKEAQAIALTELLYKAKKGTLKIIYRGTDKDMKNLWTISINNDSFIDRLNYSQIVETLIGEKITH